jgi:DNA helicase-2/ATP-dependent DNA helicase PcrA
MAEDYLKGLNSPQREAVCHIEGPLLVLAGAGSGKTKVITHRIAHIVAIRAARADQILGVTFTNKAAGEMKDRVIKILGLAGRHVRLSTFHSFCASVLRQHAEAVGYKRDFTIYDEADSLALIKRVIRELKTPEGQPSPGTAQNKISHAKDKLFDPGKFADTAADFIEENIARIYKEYQAQLNRNNAFDFDDLLFSMVTMLENNPQLKEYYQNKFPFILVDEYQDTNFAQYMLVKYLSGPRKNVCVVGDDDQSIYGWRGADINNILNFEHDFPGCKVIALEQNYRSTATVLEAAHKVVSKNLKRKSKKLFTVRQGGENISLMLCGDDRDEAAAVTAKIKFGLSQDKTPADFVVLYRTNAQSRSLEDALRDAGIPYVIVGGTRFYDRKEIKDVIAYLRLLINPDDTDSLLRIINIPKRGLGDVSIEKLLKIAARHGISAFEMMNKPEEADLKGKPALELKKLYGILNGLSTEIPKIRPDEIAVRLIEQIGYLKMLDLENTPEADVRADNVRELVSGIIAYMERIDEESEGEEKPTLAGFLENVALITDIDTWNDKEKSVTLMTVHAAKGLEFDTVFVTGLEDGLFPLIRESTDQKDMEEERRLCYVAITRAKNKLCLSMAGFRRRYNNSYNTEPSQFLFDIPENLLDIERFNFYSEFFYGPTLPPPKSYDLDFRRKTGDRRLSDKEPNAPEQFGQTVDDLLKVGLTVSHHKFGVGKIIAREGKGEDMILTIRFGGGTKKVIVRYAALEVLG